MKYSRITLFIILFISSIILEPSIRTILIIIAMGLLVTDKSNSVVLKIIVCIALLFIVFWSMIFKSYLINKNNFTRIKGDETLIVLGSQIIKDQPHMALKLRLDEAIKIMKKHPNIRAIVSGAQGYDEEYTEASIMKKYMVENGIKEERIILEEKATSTITNFELSKKIIEERNLNPNIIVTTNNYHAYRSEIIARKIGFKSILLVSAPSKFLNTSILNPFREVLSHLKVILVYRII